MGRQARHRQARREIRTERTPTLPASLFGFAAIVVVTFIAYFPAMRAGYVWDDQALTENRLLRDWGGLVKLWTEPAANKLEQHYWPLVYTTFWFERKFWGLAPLGYHLVNVLLHAANSLLVWRILLRIGVPGAWLAGAIFALHPAHVESVAWVIERKDVLSGLFYLLAFRSFARFEEADQSGRRWISYGLAILLFLCAMLSKSVAVTLPFAIGIWIWWKGGRLNLKDALRIAPFLAIGLAISLLDFVAFRARSNFDSGLSIPERILLVGRVLVFYAGKVFWPVNCMVNYPRWQIDAGNVALWLYPAAVIVLLGALFHFRRKIGRGPLAAVLFFAITHGPTSGVIDFGFMSYSYVADRFQYLASTGLIALIATLAASLSPRLHDIDRRLPFAAMAAVLLLLGYGTWVQASAYRDMETLFRDTLRKNPRSWMAYYNVGFELDKQGKLTEAVDYYSRALDINPQSPETLNNMGLAQLHQGKIDQAIDYFNGAGAIRPNGVDAPNNLGLAYFQKGDAARAIEYFNQALKIDPRDAEVLTNLGAAYLQQGDARQAAETLSRALESDSENVEAHNNLGKAQAQLGKPDAAIQSFERAVTLRPNYAKGWNNLGIARLRQGRVEEAIRDFQKALEIDPGYENARENLRRATEKR